MIPHEVMYDEGTCKRCGRKISDELSLDRGYGPKCYEKVQTEEKKQMKIDEVV